MARSVFMIPVFNQVRELPGLLQELQEAGPACDTVVFVDNGSDDGSSELIADSGYEHIDVPVNRGIGYAFMVSTDWALERGYDVYGVLAGNGKMLPSEMPRLLEPVASGAVDYVTGSRFMPGGASPNLPPFRRATIPVVNGYVRALTGQRVTDATCGYACYRLSLFQRAGFDWHASWLETYGFEYYLRAKVMLDGTIPWREVPVTMRYPKTGPYSKIRPFTGWAAMLRPWLVARVDGRGFGPPPPERTS